MELVRVRRGGGAESLTEMSGFFNINSKSSLRGIWIFCFYIIVMSLTSL